MPVREDFQVVTAGTFLPSSIAANDGVVAALGVWSPTRWVSAVTIIHDASAAPDGTPGACRHIDWTRDLPVRLPLQSLRVVLAPTTAPSDHPMSELSTARAACGDDADAAASVFVLGTTRCLDLFLFRIVPERLFGPAVDPGDATGRGGFIRNAPGAGRIISIALFHPSLLLHSPSSSATVQRSFVGVYTALTRSGGVFFSTTATERNDSTDGSRVAGNVAAQNARLSLWTRSLLLLARGEGGGNAATVKEDGVNAETLARYLRVDLHGVSTSVASAVVRTCADVVPTEPAQRAFTREPAKPTHPMSPEVLLGAWGHARAVDSGKIEPLEAALSGRLSAPGGEFDPQSLQQCMLYRPGDVIRWAPFVSFPTKQVLVAEELSGKKPQGPAGPGTPATPAASRSSTTAFDQTMHLKFPAPCDAPILFMSVSEDTESVLPHCIENSSNMQSGAAAARIISRVAAPKFAVVAATTARHRVHLYAVHTPTCAEARAAWLAAGEAALLGASSAAAASKRQGRVLLDLKEAVRAIAIVPLGTALATGPSYRLAGGTPSWSAWTRRTVSNLAAASEVEAAAVFPSVYPMALALDGMFAATASSKELASVLSFCSAPADLTHVDSAGGADYVSGALGQMLRRATQSAAATPSGEPKQLLADLLDAAVADADVPTSGVTAAGGAHIPQVATPDPVMHVTAFVARHRAHVEAMRFGSFGATPTAGAVELADCGTGAKHRRAFAGSLSPISFFQGYRGGVLHDLFPRYARPSPPRAGITRDLAICFDVAGAGGSGTSRISGVNSSITQSIAKAAMTPADFLDAVSALHNVSITAGQLRGLAITVCTEREVFVVDPYGVTALAMQQVGGEPTAKNLEGVEFLPKILYRFQGMGSVAVGSHNTWVVPSAGADASPSDTAQPRAGSATGSRYVSPYASAVAALVAVSGTFTPAVAGATQTFTERVTEKFQQSSVVAVASAAAQRAPGKMESPTSIPSVPLNGTNDARHPATWMTHLVPPLSQPSPIAYAIAGLIATGSAVPPAFVGAIVADAADVPIALPLAGVVPRVALVVTCGAPADERRRTDGSSQHSLSILALTPDEPMLEAAGALAPLAVCPPVPVAAAPTMSAVWGSLGGACDGATLARRLLTKSSGVDPSTAPLGPLLATDLSSQVVTAASALITVPVENATPGTTKSLALITFARAGAINTFPQGGARRGVHGIVSRSRIVLLQPVAVAVTAVPSVPLPAKDGSASNAPSPVEYSAAVTPAVDATLAEPMLQLDDALGQVALDGVALLVPEGRSDVSRHALVIVRYTVHAANGPIPCALLTVVRLQYARRPDGGAVKSPAPRVIRFVDGTELTLATPAYRGSVITHALTGAQLVHPTFSVVGAALLRDVAVTLPSNPSAGPQWITLRRATGRSVPFVPESAAGALEIDGDAGDAPSPAAVPASGGLEGLMKEASRLPSGRVAVDVLPPHCGAHQHGRNRFHTVGCTSRSSGTAGFTILCVDEWLAAFDRATTASGEDASAVEALVLTLSKLSVLVATAGHSASTQRESRVARCLALASHLVALPLVKKVAVAVPGGLLASSSGAFFGGQRARQSPLSIQRRPEVDEVTLSVAPGVALAGFRRLHIMRVPAPQQVPAACFFAADARLRYSIALAWSAQGRCFVPMVVRDRAEAPHALADCQLVMLRHRRFGDSGEGSADAILRVCRPPWAAAATCERRDVEVGPVTSFLAGARRAAAVVAAAPAAVSAPAPRPPPAQATVAPPAPQAAAKKPSGFDPFADLFGPPTAAPTPVAPSVPVAAAASQGFDPFAVMAAAVPAPAPQRPPAQIPVDLFAPNVQPPAVTPSAGVAPPKDPTPARAAALGESSDGDFSFSMPCLLGGPGGVLGVGAPADVDHVLIVPGATMAADGILVIATLPSMGVMACWAVWNFQERKNENASTNAQATCKSLQLPGAMQQLLPPAVQQDLRRAVNLAAFGAETSMGTYHAAVPSVGLYGTANAGAAGGAASDIHRRFNTKPFCESFVLADTAVLWQRQLPRDRVVTSLAVTPVALPAGDDAERKKPAPCCFGVTFWDGATEVHSLLSGAIVQTEVTRRDVELTVAASALVASTAIRPNSTTIREQEIIVSALPPAAAAASVVALPPANLPTKKKLNPAHPAERRAAAERVMVEVAGTMPLLGAGSAQHATAVSMSLSEAMFWRVRHAPRLPVGALLFAGHAAHSRLTALYPSYGALAATTTSATLLAQVGSTLVIGMDALLQSAMSLLRARWADVSLPRASSSAPTKPEIGKDDGLVRQWAIVAGGDSMDQAEYERSRRMMAQGLEQERQRADAAAAIKRVAASFGGANLDDLFGSAPEPVASPSSAAGAASVEVLPNGEAYLPENAATVARDAARLLGNGLLGLLRWVTAWLEAAASWDDPAAVALLLQQLPTERSQVISEDAATTSFGRYAYLPNELAADVAACGLSATVALLLESAASANVGMQTHDARLSPPHGDAVPAAAPVRTAKVDDFTRRVRVAIKDVMTASGAKGIDAECAAQVKKLRMTFAALQQHLINLMDGAAARAEEEAEEAAPKELTPEQLQAATRADFQRVLGGPEAAAAASTAASGPVTMSAGAIRQKYQADTSDSDSDAEKPTGRMGRDASGRLRIAVQLAPAVAPSATAPSGPGPAASGSGLLPPPAPSAIAPPPSASSRGLVPPVGGGAAGRRVVGARSSGTPLPAQHVDPLSSTFGSSAGLPPPAPEPVEKKPPGLYDSAPTISAPPVQPPEAPGATKAPGLYDTSSKPPGLYDAAPAAVKPASHYSVDLDDDAFVAAAMTTVSFGPSPTVAKPAPAAQVVASGPEADADALLRRFLGEDESPQRATGSTSRPRDDDTMSNAGGFGHQADLFASAAAAAAAPPAAVAPPKRSTLFTEFDDDDDADIGFRPVAAPATASAILTMSNAALFGSAEAAPSKATSASQQSAQPSLFGPSTASSAVTDPAAAFPSTSLFASSPAIAFAGAGTSTSPPASVSKPKTSAAADLFKQFGIDDDDDGMY